MELNEFRPTHKGFLYGFVPVLIDLSCPGFPVVAVRGKGVIKIAFQVLMDVVRCAVGCYIYAAKKINPGYIPSCKISITGEIKK